MMSGRGMRVCGSAAVCALLFACDRAPSHDHPPPSPSGAEALAPGMIRVSYEGREALVRLGDLQHGGAKVRLLDVWEAAKLGAPASRLRFDFVGSDGFHPTSRPKCPELVDGALLDRGAIDVTTRGLSWEDSLGLAGCYRVRDTVRMSAVAQEPAPR